MKSVQIRDYLRSVFSSIWSEYRKIWTRNNSLFGRFSRSVKNGKITKTTKDRKKAQSKNINKYISETCHITKLVPFYYIILFLTYAVILYLQN